MLFIKLAKVALSITEKDLEDENRNSMQSINDNNSQPFKNFSTKSFLGIPSNKILQNRKRRHPNGSSKYYSHIVKKNSEGQFSFLYTILSGAEDIENVRKKSRLCIGDFCSQSKVPPNVCLSDNSSKKEIIVSKRKRLQLFSSKNTYLSSKQTKPSISDHSVVKINENICLPSVMHGIRPNISPNLAYQNLYVGDKYLEIPPDSQKIDLHKSPFISANLESVYAEYQKYRRIQDLFGKFNVLFNLCWNNLLTNALIRVATLSNGSHLPKSQSELFHGVSIQGTNVIDEPLDLSSSPSLLLKESFPAVTAPNDLFFQDKYHTRGYKLLAADSTPLIGNNKNSYQHSHNYIARKVQN